jgi:RHS repeat-associated protein
MRVRDAAGIIRARTEVRYDEASFPLITYAAVTGWVAPPTTARGNPTTSRRWLDTDGTWLETHSQYDQCGNVRKAWDAGDVTLTNPSQVDYTDSFSDGVARNTYAYPTVVTTAAPNHVPVPKPSPESGAFAAGTFGSVVGLTTVAVYDFKTGLIISSINPNDKTTSYDYTDPLNRLKRVNLPDGGRTTYNYVDEHQCGSHVETRTLLNASGRELVSWQFLDGLGRPYLSETLESQDPANPYLRMDTVYDSLGRVSQVSNPYRSSGCTQQANPSGRWTETAYDALGRVKTVTTPDGAKVYTLYDGERVLVTDQARKQRVSKSDALGRLTEVWEVRPTDSATSTESVSFPIPEELSPAIPQVSAGYKTGYTYDVLGNLRKVEQGAQQRFFMYDSLGRLTRARNPEQATNNLLAVADPVTQNGQWAVAYGYDANGNLTSRTDARGVTTTYTYDHLNRNILTHYAGGGTPTPDVRRYYDKTGTEFNGLGRLWWTETVNLSATVIDGYDPAGRPKQRTQKFWKGGDWEQASAYGTSYEYNLAGGVTRHIYPSGHEVIYNYDAAGRIGDNGSHSAFKGTLGDAAERTYASLLTYSEFGGIQQERFGTQTPLYHKRHYNRRGQLFDIRLSTAPWAADQWNWNRGAILNYYSGNYAWEGDPATPAGADNNGNLRRQQHWVPADDQISSHAFVQQTYEYDALNRLAWVAEATGANGTAGPDSLKQAYDYDRWGNRTINSGETWLGQPTAPPSDLVNEKQFDRGDLQHTNRLYAPGDTATQDMGQRRMRYDVAGNLIYDDYTGKGARTYDAENRMTAAADENGGTASYAYDADGHRVKRLAGGAGEVWQVYGAGGELLAEYANDAPHTSPRKEYGYRGGELLVTAELASAGEWGPPPSFSGPDPLSTGDPIKLENMTELRSAVNQLRQHAGLAPGAFTVDPNPESNVTTVKADHIRQLRAALEEARSQLGLSVGGYAHPTLTENSSLIYAIDFQELREQIRGAWQSGTGGVDLRWLVSDHLGTPRMAVDRMGSLSAVTRHDYFPFGEEVGGDLGGRTTAQGYFRADGTRQEFTGYERDNETGLDFAQARYFASAQGRFTSPDEFFNDATPVSPQKWNLYAYVNNNPLNAVDPTGMRTDFIDQDGNRTRIDDGRDQVIYAHSRVVDAMRDYYSTNVLLYSWHLGQMQESRFNLHMTTGDFDKLAGVIYAEASNRATPGEAAAIHGVLRNRAKDDNNTVLDQAMDTSQVFGARDAERVKIFDKFASVSKRQAVYLGIAMSVVTGNDFSKGAYFWHGVDFKESTKGSHAHERFYLVGFQFTSKSHDIWNLGDRPSSNPKVPYVFQSTAAHGQTTFMRLTETWKQAKGAKTWRGK